MVFLEEEKSGNNKSLRRIKFGGNMKGDKQCRPEGHCHHERRSSKEKVRNANDQGSVQEKRRNSKGVSKTKRQGSRANFSSLFSPGGSQELRKSGKDRLAGSGSNKHGFEAIIIPVESMDMHHHARKSSSSFRKSSSTVSSSSSEFSDGELSFDAHNSNESFSDPPDDDSVEDFLASVDPLRYRSKSPNRLGSEGTRIPSRASTGCISLDGDAMQGKIKKGKMRRRKSGDGDCQKNEGSVCGRRVGFIKSLSAGDLGSKLVGIVSPKIKKRKKRPVRRKLEDKLPVLNDEFWDKAIWDDDHAVTPAELKAFVREFKPMSNH
eukprot:scaffold7745_cov103-Cylindrotheca_fusiformis.AAC.9